MKHSIEIIYRKAQV